MSKPLLLSATIVTGAILHFVSVGGNAFAGEAFGVPVSDRVLTGSILLPGGEKVGFTAREGTLLTVRRSAGESAYFYAFQPKVDDESRQSLTWEPLKIVEDILGQHVHGIDPPSAGVVDKPTSFLLGENDARLSFQILTSNISTSGSDWAASEDVLRLPPGELERKYGVSAGGTCCVTCPNGTTVCATSVDRYCGSCTSTRLNLRLDSPAR